jgi:hypothetical protein
MSAAEDAVRAGMADDVERQRDQIEMLHGSRELLTSILRNELRDEVRIGVSEGITAAMTDEAAERFWAKGFEVAQKQAKQRLRDGAGDLALGALRGLFKWGSYALLTLAFAYYVGGWTLAKAAWTAIKQGAVR